MKSTFAHLRFGVISLTLVLLFGTLGYMIIEDWSLMDSFYMTIITISTTGFKEVSPLSNGGRWVTIFLVISGVGLIAYTIGRGVQLIIENQFFWRKKMQLKLQNMSDHYIVCGYGRMGNQICDALFETKMKFIVVENEPNKIEILKEKQFVFVEGDATADEYLTKAGIERAKGLVAVLRTDAQNVFTTLSAKELNPNLYVVARAIDDGTESKLKKAGADRVVLPYELGGNRMVQLLMRPGVIDFIDGVARNKNIDISLEEIAVGKNSELINLSLKDSPIRSRLNIIIVAIEKGDKFTYNPKSDSIIEYGDKLIAIGETSMLNELTKICNS